MKKIKLILLLIVIPLYVLASKSSYIGYNKLNLEQTLSYINYNYFGDIFFTDYDKKNNKIKYVCLDNFTLEYDDVIGDYTIYIVYDVIFDYNVGYMEIKNVQYDCLIYKTYIPGFKYPTTKELLKKDKDLINEIDYIFKSMIWTYENY